ncbi:hypothetical protein SUGI_0377540 [Cryptomeria japonica]|nr:hypothetical protein SUGI_0377540 [Cryptomeria japonica]
MTSSNDEEHFFSVITSPNSDVSKCWYLDSKATQHMTPQRGWFTLYKEVPKGKTVNLGDDSKIERIGVGNVSLKMSDGAQKKIHYVWYVLALAKSILSISKITNAGIFAQFDSKVCVLNNEEGVTIAKGVRDGNLYKLCAAVTEVVLATTDAENSDLVLGIIDLDKQIHVPLRY